MKKIVLGSIALVVVLIGCLMYLLQRDNNDRITVCTQEAKQCPDGSYVGRTGRNCEFAKCPEFKPKSDFIPINPMPKTVSK